jgi:hypothetical protein
VSPHTHTCPRCAACDERRHDANVHASGALDWATRAGALVRCADCKRLHGENAGCCT